MFKTMPVIRYGQNTASYDSVEIRPVNDACLKWGTISFDPHPQYLYPQYDPIEIEDEYTDEDGWRQDDCYERVVYVDSGETIIYCYEEDLLIDITVKGDCGSYVVFEVDYPLTIVPFDIGPKVDTIAVREWSKLALANIPTNY